jgi:RimJ/RimL family protein N-acetyltransferase
MLSGLLVDLVPFGERFFERVPEWENGPAAYWGDGGDRQILSQSQWKRWHDEWLERVDKVQVSGLQFGILTKDGTPIGLMGVNFALPASRVANLGAYIGEPDFWGGGYGTDALLLLLDYLFGWWDLRKVWLGTMSSNVRVIRQMEKVGFMLEARSRHMMYGDGEWFDEMVFGLLREEFPGYAAVVERLGLKAKA